MSHFCSPSTLEVKARESEIQGHLWLQCEFETDLSFMNPCLNNKKQIKKPKTGKCIIRAARQGRWSFDMWTTTGLFCNT